MYKPKLLAPLLNSHKDIHKFIEQRLNQLKLTPYCRYISVKTEYVLDHNEVIVEISFNRKHKLILEDLQDMLYREIKENSNIYCPLRIRARIYNPRFYRLLKI